MLLGKEMSRVSSSTRCLLEAAKNLVDMALDVRCQIQGYRHMVGTKYLHIHFPVLLNNRIGSNCFFTVGSVKVQYIFLMESPIACNRKCSNNN